ncbi:MAG: iron-containing redox enzyme family protein [Blastocatellia bacterium]
MEMNQTVEENLSKIGSHEALRNDFYREWMSRSLSIEELEVFARNYGAWVRSFPNALATLIVTTGDLEAKGEYVRTLYSEMGYGNNSKAHSILLDMFFRELGKRLGDSARLEWKALERTIEVLPSTAALIAGELDLYRDPERSTGAQLALEWQAYTMLRQLYDGARNYLQLWENPDEFHEACEYFYAHIGAAEKDHKEESLRALNRFASEGGSLQRVIEGYDRHLELIGKFWNGLHGATFAARAKQRSA